MNQPRVEMIPRMIRQKLKRVKYRIHLGLTWKKLCVAIAVVGLFTLTVSDRVHAEDGMLGIMVANIDVEYPYVTHIFNSSGAATSGLRILDFIHTVDGTTIKNMELAPVIKLLKGPAGSTVVVTVKHPNDTAERTVSIVLMSAERQLNEDFDRGETAFYEKDYEAAAKYVKRAAERGHPIAQYRLGGMYLDGKGVKASGRNAKEWLQKSADQGFAAAQFRLGWAHRHDVDGVEHDEIKSVQLYHRAAEQGYLPALYELGWMYSHGSGVEQDDINALRWYREAAERGHSDAQYHLGRAYEEGKGVAKDIEEAKRLFRQSAEQDSLYAQKQLDGMRANEKNLAVEAEAAGQYRKALEHYVLSLRTGKLNHGILKRSIRIAQQLNPSPAVPEQAKKYSIFAEVARDEAQYNKGGLTQAVEEYVNAIRLAPWWPLPYLNTAFIEEERGRFHQARAYLELYQLASDGAPPMPGAPTADDIQHKLYELEYKIK